MVSAGPNLEIPQPATGPAIATLNGSVTDDGLPQGKSLTIRESEVLQLIVHGKSNKEIAGILGLSVNTVSVHRANIMETLGMHNTAELVVYAIRCGLVSIA